MISQYDGEITWHDHYVNRLLEALRARGRLDDAVVVITADHGEAFGEHGVWAHTAGMFNEVVQIPLIIWSSSPSMRRGRTRVPASLLDIAPTLSELAGARIPAAFDGSSLVPWLEGRADSGRIIFIENPNRGEIGLRNDEWAYFEGRKPEGFGRWLYSADDVRHEKDLSADHPEVVRQLSALARRRREMDRARGAESVEIELSPERIEQLRELGYIAD
jgi:arylsulfatase A-like enzyme